MADDKLPALPDEDNKDDLAKVQYDVGKKGTVEGKISEAMCDAPEAAEDHSEPAKEQDYELVNPSPAPSVKSEAISFERLGAEIDVSDSPVLLRSLEPVSSAECVILRPPSANYDIPTPDRKNSGVVEPQPSFDIKAIPVVEVEAVEVQPLVEVTKATEPTENVASEQQQTVICAQEKEKSFGEAADRPNQSAASEEAEGVSTSQETPADPKPDDNGQEVTETTLTKVTADSSMSSEAVLLHQGANIDVADDKAEIAPDSMTRCDPAAAEADQSTADSDPAPGSTVEVTVVSDTPLQLIPEPHPVPTVVVDPPESPKEEQMDAEKMDSSTPVAPSRRNSIRSTASMGASCPTPPTRRLSMMRKAQSASATPDRPRSLASPVNLPRGRLYFPSTGTLPATPEESLRQGKKGKRGMFSWLGGDSSKKKNKEVLESVSDGLRKIYKQKLYPLEEHYKFHEFHSPALDDPDFDAKPMILLVGQYSTGKTTFIRYLLEQDFPGIRIGPEPTTDRFIAVMHGDEDGVIPGNALVVDAKKQFRALSGFGNAFLNRFQCSSLPNQVLESVTIVDTPGILSGEKQRIDRGYDFTGVLEWFAERVDRIILLFDAHKLDISDEFKRCIEALSGNEDKIRIVLNKSDMVDHQQLMRVYGALMWSLGKVFKTPEVSRVYLGSFWDHPLHYDINRRLFQDEQHDLFSDLQALPRNAALRKLNDLIKRARLAKVHAYIINELRKQMPSMIGKDKKKKELIQNLDKIYEQLQREHNISPGDFPDINKMREKLQLHDFSKFNPLKPKLLEVVDGMLAHDIARLMSQIPKEEATAIASGAPVDPTVKGGAFSQAVEAETPFGFGKYGKNRGEGFDKGADESEWVVNRERSQADSTFDSLGPVNGYLSGRSAKEHMVKSKLPNSVLGKVWKLADVDRDGQLDADEFALANYLINLKLEGHELPSELPKHLVPPSKRENGDAVYPKLEDDE